MHDIRLAARWRVARRAQRPPAPTRVFPLLLRRLPRRRCRSRVGAAFFSASSFARSARTASGSMTSLRRFPSTRFASSASFRFSSSSFSSATRRFGVRRQRRRRRDGASRDASDAALARSSSLAAAATPRSRVAAASARAFELHTRRREFFLSALTIVHGFLVGLLRQRVRGERRRSVASRASSLSARPMAARS